MLYCAGDVFPIIAPTDNDENVKYYLMRCNEKKMKLLEDYNDHIFPYERGSIILKGYFFKQTNQSGYFFYFEDYEPDVISCQYSHMVLCSTHKVDTGSIKEKKTKI